MRTSFRIAFATLSMLAFSAGCGFASWQRAAKQCYGEAAPITTRPAVQQGAYTAANESLLAMLPLPDGATQTDVTANPYRRCSETPGSEIVGVVTRASFAIEAHLTKCDVALFIEGRLAKDGWSVQPLETSDPRGGGTIRYTDFWKGMSHVTLSLNARPTTYYVSVDHDSVAKPPEGATRDTPCETGEAR